VKQLSDLADISVRTPPLLRRNWTAHAVESRENGYRYYDDAAAARFSRFFFIEKSASNWRNQADS